MIIHGVEIGNRVSKIAQTIILEKGAKPGCLKQWPEVFTVYKLLRDTIKGGGLPAILDIIMHPKNSLMCICGKETITHFNSDNSPHKCNNGWDCKDFCAYRVKQTEKTSLEQYGCKHAGQRPEAKRKRIKTNLARYGTKNPAQSKEVQDRMAKTNLERYGATNIFGSEYGQTLIRKGNLKRFGVEYASQAQEVRDKVRETNLERFGTVAPAQNIGILRKMQDTCYIRYGARSPFESKVIQRKIKKTMLKRYRADSPFDSAEIKKRIAATNLERYGAENIFASEYGKELIRKGMLNNHGVEHALQSPEIHRRQQATAYSHKTVRFDNRWVTVQGYEEEAIYYLRGLGIPMNKIRLSMEGKVPSIYYVNGGKRHVYHPDLAVGNTIIEVKSTWTLLGDRSKLRVAQLKAEATLQKGYRFVLLLVLKQTDNSLTTLRLPKNWVYSTFSDLKFYVGKFKGC